LRRQPGRFQQAFHGAANQIVVINNCHHIPFPLSGHDQTLAARSSTAQSSIGGGAIILWYVGWNVTCGGHTWPLDFDE
jgi:hypothetical protein